MKLFLRIFSYIFLILGAIISLVFSFVEIRSLIAGDFLLFNSAAIGAIQYLFRGLFFIGISAFSIYLFIWFLLKKALTLSHYIFAGALLISSIFTVFFYVLNIYFVAILLALIPLIVVGTRRFIQ